MFTGRKAKILKWIGYAVFFLVCFVISLAWTFPFNMLKGKISDHMKSEFNLIVDMENISSSFPFGIEAENVSIDSTEEGNNLFPISIPYLEAKVGLFSALSGNVNLDYNAELFGGEIDGSLFIDQAAKSYRSRFDIEDFDLTKIEYFKKSYKDLPLAGTISVEADIDYSLEKVESSNGFLEFSLRNGSVGPGKVGVEIPKLVTGDLDCRIEMKKGKLEIASYKQDSPDMESDVMGTITLSKRPALSRVNIDHRFKIAERLVKRGSIFELGLATIKNAQGSDGYYYHTARGAFMNVRTKPNKAAEHKFRNKSAKGDKVKDRKKAARDRRMKAKKDAEKKKNSRSRAQKGKTDTKRENKLIKPSSKDRKKGKSQTRRKPPKPRRPPKMPKNMAKETIDEDELEEEVEEVEETEEEVEENEEAQEPEEEEEESDETEDSADESQADDTAEAEEE